MGQVFFINEAMTAKSAEQIVQDGDENQEPGSKVTNPSTHRLCLSSSITPDSSYPRQGSTDGSDPTIISLGLSPGLRTAFSRLARAST